jgi:hypothetical protein
MMKNFLMLHGINHSMVSKRAFWGLRAVMPAASVAG